MKKFYVLSMVLLTLLLTALSHDSALINTQRATIASYEDLVRQKDANYDSMMNQWKETYNRLDDRYTKKFAECSKLSEELRVYRNSAELPVYEYSKKDILLLATCVQCEAGDYADAPNSQKYVAQVILNRMKSKEFPNNISDVIYQKVHGDSQFTVAYNGMMENCVLETKTLENVYEVIVHGTDLPSYITYFYSEHVKHNWVNTLKTYCVVEGTVFAYE